MGIWEVIEYQDPSGQEICRKLPESGSAETRMGSQLVVREYQAAVFFRDGKGLDVFGPGRHTLTTQNIPLLARLVGKLFDGDKSPFRTEIVFVNQNIFNEMKWGTKEAVPFKDSELGYVQLRAFGNFTMRVKDPLLFVNTLVGGRGRYSTNDIANFLRDIAVSRFNDIIGEVVKTVFELAAMYDELSVAAKMRMTEDFAKYGIELIDFYINAVTPPEEVQKAINERASMGALGDMSKYMQYQSAKAMREAAVSPGGAGGAMAAGLGAGMGMMMPQMMAQSMQQMQQQQMQLQQMQQQQVQQQVQPQVQPQVQQQMQPQAPTPPPTQQTVPAPAPGQSGPAERLQKLKALMDQGLINQEEFDAKKKQILAEI